ncbi:DUF3575 domain-containing protein [Millionella massiliensis]|uniref:DUF3575 domain-containing protein n=1 Tax=Millionella massiliensis TaxID=1871023 RepID=UPI0008D9F705|nr:DUF3575 domain-containing protein [Millionella massiliensis]
MFKFLVGTLVLLNLWVTQTWAQSHVSLRDAQVVDDTVIFRFAPGKRRFYAAYKGNDRALDFLSRSIREHYVSIDSGNVKMRVRGFCSSYDTYEENLKAAKNRSNQVKSYFIVHEGLKEEHFRTSNSTRKWRGMDDVVAVAYLFRTNQLRDCVIAQLSKPDTSEVKISEEVQDSSEGVEPVEPRQEPQTTPVVVEPEVLKKTSGFRWAIKTNVAYLAATVANLGVEFGFGKHYSIDVPVIYSPYTIKRDYKLRFLAVQPEFRYWLAEPMSKHFFGVHLNIGAFNVAVDSKSRYQSPDGFYGAGISYGYVLPFARHWAAEFTIGAGYVHTKYDAYYNIPNGACYEKGVPYNYWGLTKVGVNLVYKFGK